MLTEGERNPANSKTDFISSDNLFSFLMFTAKEIHNQLDKCCDDLLFRCWTMGMYTWQAPNYRLIGMTTGGCSSLKSSTLVTAAAATMELPTVSMSIGNCLDYEPGTQNENLLYLTGDGNTFDEEQKFCTMTKIFHIHLKVSGEDRYYSSFQALIEDTPNIGVSKGTLDRSNFAKPFDNDICIIKRGLVFSAGEVREGLAVLAPEEEQYVAGTGAKYKELNEFMKKVLGIKFKQKTLDNDE